MKQTRKTKSEEVAKVIRHYLAEKKPSEQARETFLRKPYSNEYIK